MKQKSIAIIIVLAVIAVIGFVLANNKKKIEEKKKVVDRSNIPVAVTTAKAEVLAVGGTLSLPATLEAAHKAQIAALTGGRLTSLRVALGTHVTAGQIVGSIDISQQQLSEKDAAEALAKAERDYKLAKELFAGNAGTEQSVKDAAHNLEAAQIRLQLARQKVADGYIKSPITGIITEKKGEPGEYTNPGTPLATVVDVNNLKAVVFVGEKDVYRLQLNQSAEVIADVMPNKSFTGTLSFISPIGDENHNYKVELTLTNNKLQLKAGTFVKVNFNFGDNYQALQVPKLALAEGTKNPYVYIISGSKATKKTISTGREIGENIEVLSGLQAGDEVVINGHINLTNGCNITRVANAE